MRCWRRSDNRVRDHLANERTFLAWLRTGLAVAIFGSAIGETRRQLDAGRFEPAGLLVDLAGAPAALFGLALAAYLVYIAFRF